MVEPHELDDRDGVPTEDNQFLEPGTPDLFGGDPDPDDLDFEEECEDCGELESECVCDDLDALYDEDVQDNEDDEDWDDEEDDW